MGFIISFSVLLYLIALSRGSYADDPATDSSIASGVFPPNTLATGSAGTSITLSTGPSSESAPFPISNSTTPTNGPTGLPPVTQTTSDVSSIQTSVSDSSSSVSVPPSDSSTEIATPTDSSSIVSSASSVGSSTGGTSDSTLSSTFFSDSPTSASSDSATASGVTDSSTVPDSSSTSLSSSETSAIPTSSNSDVQTTDVSSTPPSSSITLIATLPPESTGIYAGLPFITDFPNFSTQTTDTIDGVTTNVATKTKGDDGTETPIVILFPCLLFCGGGGGTEIIFNIGPGPGIYYPPSLPPIVIGPDGIPTPNPPNVPPKPTGNPTENPTNRPSGSSGQSDPTSDNPSQTTSFSSSSSSSSCGTRTASACSTFCVGGTCSSSCSAVATGCSATCTGTACNHAATLVLAPWYTGGPGPYDYQATDEYNATKADAVAVDIDAMVSAWEIEDGAIANTTSEVSTLVPQTSSKSQSFIITVSISTLITSVIFPSSLMQPPSSTLCPSGCDCSGPTPLCDVFSSAAACPAGCTCNGPVPLCG